MKQKQIRQQMLEFWGQKVLEYKEAIELFHALGDHNLAKHHKEMMEIAVEKYVALRDAKQ
jgi:hypothetical protein